MSTVKLLHAFSFIVLITGTQCVRAQTPTLLTEESSPRAAALDSVTRIRDPLPVVALNNFSRDHRTRVALFGINIELTPGENATAVTASARDSKSRIYSLRVESVGKVPNQNWLTQVVVRLPDQLANAGDVWISIKLHGQASNEVLFNVKAQSEHRFVTLLARRVTNGVDNYVDACFSFEYGMNGAAALTVTGNDWDIQFGNNPTHDGFGVTMVTDDRSRLQDMGALNWGDAFQVPVLPAYPVPTDEPILKAVVGHIYAVHTADTETDLYALFRVEALEPGQSVTISWKSVQRPEGD